MIVYLALLALLQLEPLCWKTSKQCLVNMSYSCLFVCHKLFVKKLSVIEQFEISTSVMKLCSSLANIGYHEFKKVLLFWIVPPSITLLLENSMQNEKKLTNLNEHEIYAAHDFFKELMIKIEKKTHTCPITTFSFFSGSIVG